MSTLKEDLAHAIRALRRAPGFTVTVIVTLALGIGATSAMFSVIDAVLLKPLPFPGAARLVHVKWEGSGHRQYMSAAKFEFWRDHARSFEAMATWDSELARVNVGDDVVALRALAVSRDFLTVLGYAPALGRGFDAAEHVPDGPRVALISHAVWHLRFGGARDVAGRGIRIDGEPAMVVGVLPASFSFPYEDAPVEVLLPLALTADPNDIAEDWPAIARLRPGITREQAQAEVTSLTAAFRSAYPAQVSDQDHGMRLATFSELYVADGVRRALWLLMGAVTLVLLIACANVANLLLARVTRRRGEIALRTALGASRGRIVRLVFAESVLVATAAGALGLVVGRWLSSVLVALTPTEVARMTDIGVDWRVLLFTCAASFATSLLFGGAAAWPAARAGLSEVLKESVRTSAGRRRSRQALLVAQSTLAMVLLVGAGLLAATLIALMRVDPGFDPEGLVVARLPLRPAAYATSEDLWELQRRVIQGLDGSPAIAAVAGASSLPLERGINTRMTIAGRPDMVGTIEWRAVTPGYFRTLDIALLAGRSFERSDAPGTAPVAIVNQTFARAYFRGESAIGQHLEMGRRPGGPGAPSGAAVVEIIGTVEDSRDISLRAEPRRTVYVPQAQAPTALSNLSRTMPVFIARARSTGADVERVLAAALRAVDPTLPRPDIFPFPDVLMRSLARERFGAVLLATLAAFALTLTAAGIYGVLAYSVQQRRREIGIRMALGADRRQVTRLVMAQGITPVFVGLLLGGLTSVALSRLVAGFLWGVTTTDPVTLSVMAAILLGVALVASWMPAREAAGLDPAKTLAGIHPG